MMRPLSVGGLPFEEPLIVLSTLSTSLPGTFIVQMSARAVYKVHPLQVQSVQYVAVFVLLPSFFSTIILRGILETYSPPKRHDPSELSYGLRSELKCRLS